jgi:polyhydroxyalkanoate synthase
MTKTAPEPPSPPAPASGAAAADAADAPAADDDSARRLQQAFEDFTDRAQRIAKEAIDHAVEDGGFQIPDPSVVSKAFVDFNQALTSDPAKLMQAQADLWQDYARLFEAAAKRLNGEEAVEPVVEPDHADRRFKDQAWTENVLFDTLKQSYLLSAGWLSEMIEKTDGLDDATRAKVRFYSRQAIDALAPTNFLATNPAALRKAAASKGETVVKGMDQFLNDLEAGHGRLRISMTDASKFKLGETLAVTPGSVVYQNDLMQLIQYAPTTETVAKRPVLIVPPWINKYYILDLQPANSFIKWMVDQGLTVFVISWVNPDASMKDKTFADYMLEGPLAALDAVEQATGEKQVDMVGYCIGGTLAACTLAWLAAKRRKRVASATFLTTLVDFADAGELSVFIDEEQLKSLNAYMERKGYLDGAYMSQVFNMLRDNDLIWSFVVNNYLMGNTPRAFDLLYWNSDNTRMPAMMHRIYLREMYLENRLREPGGIELQGVPIDLRKIKIPVYMLSTAEDHIAPWRSTYAATQIYGGARTFVLSGSGHIAGVINPPDKNKYGYRTNADLPADPEAWLKGAEPHEGSWWPHWRAWIAARAGRAKPVAARAPGGGGLGVIEPAPGSYVQVRADE